MPLFFRPLNVDIASLLLLSENSRSLFEMKSRHTIKQGLRCLHGVLCLKLCFYYSSGEAARQYHRNGAADSVIWAAAAEIVLWLADRKGP